MVLKIYKHQIFGGRMNVTSYVVKAPDPIAARTFERFALVPPSVATEQLFSRGLGVVPRLLGVRLGGLVRLCSQTGA